MAPQSYLQHKFLEAKSFEEKWDILKRAHAYEPNNGLVILATGEFLRKSGWEADEVNEGEKLVRAAVPWFQRGIELNRWSPYNYLNLGMCYHWLKEREKAGELFERALALDPNGSYVLAMYGWHKLQLGELESARDYFYRSVVYLNHPGENMFAKSYLEIVERRIAEQAATR